MGYYVEFTDKFNGSIRKSDVFESKTEAVELAINETELDEEIEANVFIQGQLLDTHVMLVDYGIAQ